MACKVANQVQTTLASAITPGDTTISVSSTAGFPTLNAGDYFRLSLIHPTTGVTEYVKVKSYSGNDLEVDRGEEGTTPQSFPQGTYARLWLTAQTLYDVSGHYNLSVGAPSGSAGTKTVHVSVDASGYFLLRCWLVDTSTPTDELSPEKPSTLASPLWYVVTDANGEADITLSNANQSRSWYLCVSVVGKVEISDAITIGA